MSGDRRRKALVICGNPRCGEPFTPGATHQVYCGLGCYREAMKLMQATRYQEQRQAPPAPPSWGRFPSLTAARGALSAALARDGGWWGERMIERWGEAHGLGPEARGQLLTSLTAAGLVVMLGGEVTPCRWRWKGGRP